MNSTATASMGATMLVALTVGYGAQFEAGRRICVDTALPAVPFQISTRLKRSITVVPATAASDDEQVKANFQALSDVLKATPNVLGTMDDVFTSEPYRRVVAMGRPVVPLILEDLSADPDEAYSWFPALTEITGIDPVSPEHAGEIGVMANAWIAWGRQNGFMA